MITKSVLDGQEAISMTDSNSVKSKVVFVADSHD